MSFFKRNKEKGPLIPPVAAAEPKPDPYAGGGAAGGRAGGGGGDTYANQNRGGGGGDPYASARGGGGDPYALSAGGAGGGAGGGGNPYAQDASKPADAARNELFAGFSAPEKAKPARQYGYEGREQEEDFDEEEEIEGIKQEMRGVKQESLASTRNALRLAREAEETARGTVAKLADQSERIANSERYLDMAKANNQRAEDSAGELKQLNKSIFRPVVTWNKEGKRQAQENKINERHLQERLERNKAINDISDTRSRLGAATGPEYGGSSTRVPLPGEKQAKKDARAKYQVDATASDDELEDELDENLDETYEVTKRLKKLATAMGDEVVGQNQRLGRITGKTEDLEFAVMQNTERLKKIK